MNHMMLIARSAGRVCARFTVQLLFTLQGLASTRQINSYAQAVDNFAQKVKARLRHADNLWKLDWHDILQARALKGAHTAPLKRVAQWVALGFVGALCLPMSNASSGSIDAIKPKDYIRMTLDKREAVCLLRLYGKESAFNPYAIGNLSGKYHTYGIPQLKNALIADKTAIEQIHYGLKYIDHRYDGDTCKAWSHWLRKGWH
jgi:hypothetical protein